MLATILTLTGCPGPVTPDMPCTHENKKTVIETAATYNNDGLGKIICVDCGKVIDEQATISWFVAGGHDGNEENAEAYRYQYNGTQVKVYVYTFNEEKELNDLGVLYYSFEETNKTMNLNDLLHLKPEYKDYAVAYGSFYFFPNDTLKEDLKTQDPYSSYEHELESSNQIGIIIEPITN